MTGESELQFLVGHSLPSSFDGRVSYQLESVLGQGATATAFAAWRVSPTGRAKVVVKILLPHLLHNQGDLLRLAFKKEVVALGRLGEHVPPSPFVVRLIEASELAVDRLEVVLPWLALEFVHGGIEGTTLYERVAFSLQATELAYPAWRVARAVECVTEGLEAIHSVGVIHRDLNPGNVLCCGSSNEEVCKIADFGISRPVGLAATFGHMELGTPGYSSPEQMFASAEPTTVASDIFSLGAVIFMMLAGEELFPGTDTMTIIRQSLDRERRSIMAGEGLLDPELRNRPMVCREIDRVLARATSPQPEQRFERAGEVASALLPLLRGPRWGAPRSNPSPATWRSHQTSTLTRAGWTWQRLHRFGEDRVLVSAGWQSGGQCLAATSRGLEYWDGTDWQPAAAPGLDAGRVRCVRPVGPGAWVLAGDQGLVLHYSHRGPPVAIPAPPEPPTWVDMDGDPEDLAVFVGQAASGTTLLHALCGGHWLKPLPLEPMATVAGLARIGDERWLVVGRAGSGLGAVWIYDPLGWELWTLATMPTRAYVACAANVTERTGMAVGMSGAALRVDEGGVTPCPVPAEPDVSSVAIAPSGATWAASLGRLWLFSSTRMEWQCAWEDPSVMTPMVGLFADGSRVLALGADGGVLEGQRSVAEQEPLSTATPGSLRWPR